jgi:PTH1 family peptidyl-tRNA hydrolase
MAEIKMVVGLGNPGKNYAATRHNIGFRVINLLAETLKIEIRKRKFGARFGQGRLADKNLILFKPWQFVNQSGQAVATAMGFYKLALSDLLVIIDDMALPPGRIRLRAKGSAGGHNGLADIIEKLGSENVARLRIGIGRSSRQVDYDYVLDKPTNQEKPLLDEAIQKARDAATCWIQYGIQTTMNKFNNE